MIGRSTESKELERESVNRDLDEALARMQFGDTRITFVIGYPRSDIGKGNLVARLALLPDGSASIIKFDPILNTNVALNHPSPFDDFGVYRKFHPHIEMGGFNQILGGEILFDFIKEYGGSYDHLGFCPQVAKFFALRIFKNWEAIGRPEFLFVEIGGVITDAEVAIYALPGMRVLRRYHPHSTVVLLSELGHNTQYFKTKSVQNGIREALRCGIECDAIFARLPASELPLDSALIEKYVARKISNSLVYGGHVPELVLVPHYPDEGMYGYAEYLQVKCAHRFVR